jgi:hypothetical protein
MKRLLLILIAAATVSLGQIVQAQVDDTAAAKFLDSAKSSSDSQLGSIGSDLIDKVKSLGSSGISDSVKGKLNGMLKSLTGGKDMDSLTSAFDLVKGAKFTPQQTDLAKQVGNLASAFVVQKNFASLEGSQTDVATLVNSLRAGKYKDMLSPAKNVMSNAKLTDTQKQLIKTVADKYVPGLSKAAGATDALKKIPGF